MSRYLYCDVILLKVSMKLVKA